MVFDGNEIYTFLRTNNVDSILRLEKNPSNSNLESTQKHQPNVRTQLVPLVVKIGYLPNDNCRNDYL